MTLGPIEVIVIAFPGSRFNGEIRPRIMELVQQRIVTVIDALLIKKDDSGAVTFVEMQENTGDPEIQALTALATGDHDLLSDEDAETFAAQLDPGDSALAIVFEHTWMKPVRDAIAASEGFLLADLHVPAAVVDEVLAAVAAP